MFKSITDVQQKAEEWRYDYNNYHPHKSLARKNPMEVEMELVNIGKHSKLPTIN